MTIQSVNVTDVIAQIRAEADIQDPSATSICTDAELLVWVNKAYKRLYDLIAAEVGQEYFGVTASLAAPTFTLPADFYRALGVDATIDGVPVSCRQFNFLERNDFQWALRPRYRIYQGTLIWRPTASAPTTAVTLWYVPKPATLAGNGAFDAVSGWDDYVVKYVVREVRRKQEYDLGEANALLAEQLRVVQHGASRLRESQDQVADSTNIADEAYYNG